MARHHPQKRNGNHLSAIPTTDRLPPHDFEAEQGLLACLFIRPSLITDGCRHVRPEIFYDVRNQDVFKAMRALDNKRRAVDHITVRAELKNTKRLEDVGEVYLAELPEKAPSAENWSYYLGIVREKHALRKTIQVCTDTTTRIFDFEGNVEDLMLGVRADLETATAIGIGEERPALKIWTFEELKAWKAPAHLRLVGDNEINMGYEGLTLIAGPGSSGKSLAVASLALAGAIGKGTWMGRKVHRQFKTLILQAENGAVRLKGELEAMAKEHPSVDLQNHIFISEPPEGGLPFHKIEFRVAVRRQVEMLKPSLVVLDPWSQIAVDDSAKDVMDKLAEIRSCFPAGEECPGLVIIAHTKKPRPEDVRRGRALVNLVSGSIALPNTCRCCYLLLPWTEDLTDPRIYWSCPKLNNGEMYEPSVWKRRYGTFFEQDTATDHRTWGDDENQELDTRKIKPGDVIKAFGSEHVLTKSDLAKRLEKQIGVAYSTTMAAVTPGTRGYLSWMVEKTAEGWIKLKEDAK